MIDFEEVHTFIYDDYNSKFRDDEITGTLTTNIGSSSLRGGQKLCIPVLTPDRIEKRQNGRRFKEDGDPEFTLTAQDIHGVALGVIRQVRSDYGKQIRKDYEEGNMDISRHEFLESEVREDGLSNTVDTVTKDNLLAIDVTPSSDIHRIGNYMPSGHNASDIIEDNGISPTVMENHGTVTATPLKVKNATDKGYDDADIEDSVNLALPNSKTRRGRVDHQVAQTLDTSCNQGVVVAIDVDSKDEEHPGLYIKLAEDFIIYAVWYEKYKCYITVRKLTPKECFRLQGWSDDYFEKAEFVNSNSQLYKQAGNGITVNVTEAIGKML